MNEQDIGFFPDEKIHTRLQKMQHHSMMQALLHYAFPNKRTEEITAILDSCHSTRDFQAKVIYPALQRLLDEHSEGLTTGGFDKLKKDAAYLYISNHRDIVLDTGLTNYALLEKQMTMTASAIGDNLVSSEWLLEFSKINRNFLVRRGLSPRETLLSSRHLSRFIANLILKDKQSVWIAQREGRAKEGNDVTHPGVIKMLTLAKDQQEKGLDHLLKLKLVPLAISYELDPTDHLKVRELLAASKGAKYEKEKGEDFQSILAGLLGQKKRIHIQAGKLMNDEIQAILQSVETESRHGQVLSRLIDREIQRNYRLWPTNYIAFDELFGTDRYACQYTKEEKQVFLDRMERKLAAIPDPDAGSIFLRMYANPVVNKEQWHDSQSVQEVVEAAIK